MLNRILHWFYRWLPIIMGCHCRPDRSFYWKGKKFPVCARCTGELFGVVLALLTFWFWHPSTHMLALLLIPLVLDGVIQLKISGYTSTNPRRLWTGILFGYGILCLFFLSVIATFQFGYGIGLSLKNR